MENLRAIQKLKPNADVIGSITRGLRRVQAQLGLGEEVFNRWMEALQP
ncbi:MAG TPA: hypothetical protein VFA20_19150 [Myxococcaceae bacterium]|nr:hypothetical protein [Myxococcaceae bacterium]